MEIMPEKRLRTEEELKPDLSFLASLSPDSFMWKKFICGKNVRRTHVIVPREFNVEVDGKTFGDFISFLRRKMNLKEMGVHEKISFDYCPPNTFFEISLLTNTWFEEEVFDDEAFLELKDSPRESGKELFIQQMSRRCITLLIQMIPPDCLHVVGYGMQNRNPWLEFATYSCFIHDQIVPTFLEFFGDYASLERACGEERKNIKLGRDELIKAVNTLATSTETQERARSLLVVIQMICESVKSKYITELLVKHYETGTVPTERMLAEEMPGQEMFRLLNIRGDDFAALIPEHKKSKVGTSGCRPLEAETYLLRNVSS